MLSVLFCDITDIVLNGSECENFPENRVEYINGIKDLRRKKQSIAVWRLLYYALSLYGIDAYGKTFSCSDTGKWSLDDASLNFSLSHSENIVAVALSDGACGVDVEMCSEKILALKAKFSNEGSIDALTTLWTIKEARYKSDSSGNNFSKKISDKKGFFYILTVASSNRPADFIEVDANKLF